MSKERPEEDPQLAGYKTVEPDPAAARIGIPAAGGGSGSGTSAGPFKVQLTRTAVSPSDDLGLWLVILKSTTDLSFDNYKTFMDLLLCRRDDSDHEKDEALRDLLRRRALPFNDTDAYRLLKAATEAFVELHCGAHFKPHAGDQGHPFTPDDLEALRSRTEIDLTRSDLDNRWDRYYERIAGTSGDRVLPYMALVRRKLPGERLKETVFPFQDRGYSPATDDPATECIGILKRKLSRPCLLELIWSYWHEEGMLVQTLNAISRRFQNVRGRDRDPLANLEIDPLRPLNNLLWGYIQDEQHRLTLVRRSYEYDHHYGLQLRGRAVPPMRPADSRSRFLEAFHGLLRLCAAFFRQDDDTTVRADGFPVLNALREVHLILSEGAHNQYGDLPSTARIEMLMQQWLLARPEFREFLPTRVMVAYPEPWMDRVDAMKSLQGWTDISVLHFRNLGVFGEQVLLSIRFGKWSDEKDPLRAANWARFWRPEIQGYAHAYRSVTGVELTADRVEPQAAALMAAQPSLLLSRRLARRQLA